MKKATAILLGLMIGILSAMPALADSSDGLFASGQWIIDSPEWITALPAAQDESVTQLFVVAGMGMDKTTAYISMHEKDEDGNWKQVISTPGYVGKNGLCNDEDHAEGCGQTPIGVYKFNKAFGIAKDPGCAKEWEYRQVNGDAYWSGDPDRKYNQLVDIHDIPDLVMDDSEHIVDYQFQYQYCLNISFNEEGTPGRGSAIFLHCIGPQKPYTGGCVAIPENIMKQVMQRVRPDCVVVIDTIDNMGGSFVWPTENPNPPAPEEKTLIAADNHWALLAVLFAATAIAIWLEQKYKWASRISGAIITLVIAIILVNIHVIPASSHVYDDIIWGYAVPMAIPLLLLQTNIRKIWKETGRFLLIFLIGAVGTVAGTVLATLLLGGTVKGLPGAAAMMTGSYIGGGVNFTAIADAFHVDSSLISATTVADNLNMALYFLVLLGIAGSAFFRKKYPHPHIDEVTSKGKGDTETLARQYWTRKNVSLKDIAVDLAYAAIIVFISKLIGGFFTEIIPKDSWFSQMLNTFFGSQYVWITNFSVIFATFFHKQAEEMHGAQELGTWLIYLFFFVIGVPASIGVLIRNAPILLLFCMIIVLVNMVFCFLFGKLLRFDLEDIILASNANIGGPTTAAGMAISQGWAKLIGPCMLVGTFGYVIGTWLGILVGSLLGA